MSGHPEYLHILDEMRDMHVSKSADYGKDADPLANFRKSAGFGVAPWVGAMIRACDKVARIEAYVRTGTLKNEGVEDSLKDLASYAILALILFREGEADRPEAGPPVGPADLEGRVAEFRRRERYYHSGAVEYCGHEDGTVKGCFWCEERDWLGAERKAIRAAGGKV